MSNNVNMRKAQLRRLMRTRRRALTEAEQLDAAHRLVDQLWKIPALAHAHCLLATLPVGGEISAAAFLDDWVDRGRVLALPRVDDDQVAMTPHHVKFLADIQKGFRDCPEPNPLRCPPIPIDRIDIFLVPGLAFDRKGHRLGQGGGHFDRMLAQRRDDAVVIGIAHTFQLIDDVPIEDGLDQAMDWIATPEDIHTCPRT